jgi:hypothetical protein
LHDDANARDSLIGQAPRLQTQEILSTLSPFKGDGNRRAGSANPTDLLSHGFFSALRTLWSSRKNEDHDDNKDKDYCPESDHHSELNLLQLA